MDDPPGRLIHQLFEIEAAASPDSVALVYENRNLTYGQLNSWANEVAQTLLSRGLGVDERAGLYVEHGLEMVVGMLAILKAGAAYVPLDPANPCERLRYILEDSEPAVILTTERLREQLPVPEDRVISLPSEDRDACGSALSNPVASELGLVPSNLAYVIYTSGSTGAPKGVMVEHRGVVNLVYWHRRTFAVAKGCNCSCVAAFGFDAASWEVWSTVCNGGTLLIASAEVARDPEQLIRWWSEQPLDISFLPTPLAEEIFDRSIANSRLQTLLIGGDRLRRLPGKCAYSVVNNYGPTETTVLVTSGSVDGADGTPHIGRPIANTRIYILDEARVPVHSGETGEMYVGGVAVARGYLKRPELTLERFLPDPFTQETAGRMYRTGDLARWRPDGTIEFLGRRDGQVKIRGYRIEVGEIEQHLLQRPSVSAAAVVAHEGRSGHVSLVAYVVANHVCNEGDMATSDISSRLNAELARVLPAYMMPAAIINLDRLPLTPNGKIDRHGLAQRKFELPAARRYVPPAGDLEERLAQIWRDVLGAQPIGRDDNFFELGGNSILGVKLMGRICEELGSLVANSTVFQCPSIRLLAAQLSVSSPPTPEPPLGPRNPPETVPLTYCQQSWWRLTGFGTRGGARALFSAIRVTGPLDVGVLEKALARLVERHEALRTAISVRDGIPIQQVSEHADYSFETVVVAGESPFAREAEASRAISRLTTEPVLAGSSSLFAAKLLRLKSDDHVLVLATDHIISDGASMGVLLRELWTLYTRAVRGLPASLPRVRVQLADYAVWLRRTDPFWLDTHAPYWRKRMQGAGAFRIFEHNPVLQNMRPRFASTPVSFELELSQGLSELARSLRTTAALVMLSAYTSFLLRWCKSDDIVMAFETNGRLRPEVENLVGFLGTTLFLRLGLQDGDCLEDVVARTTREYALACEHDDRGRLEAATPRPAFAGNPSFNWFPRELRVTPPNFTAFVDHSQIDGFPDRLSLRPFDVVASVQACADGEVEWFDEPRILLAESEKGIAGILAYRADRVSEGTVARFVEDFRYFLKRLLAARSGRLMDIPCRAANVATG